MADTASPKPLQTRNRRLATLLLLVLGGLYTLAIWGVVVLN
jgi:hypothetical protein